MLTYDGLKQLKECPKLTKLSLNNVALSDEDLTKLKADLPNVAVALTPMKPEYRTQWDAWAAKQK